MNIAVNTRILLKNRMEGLAHFSYEVLSRITKAHPEHNFYFFFDRAYAKEFIFSSNITPVVLSPQARHPILWYWWFEYALKRAMDKYQIDVLFSPEDYLSLRSSVPTVMTTHDLAYMHYPTHLSFSIRNYYHYFSSRYHKRADSIIAVSNTTKTDIIKTFKIDEKKITVAYNGCNTKFSALSEEDKIKTRLLYTAGKPYFIYLGSIHPRKNVKRIIQAFEQYCENYNPNISLLLAGRWAWKTKEIKQAIARSKYKSQIIIKALPSNEVSKVLASAEALIYVSLLEGFGLPILEAFNCDIPVICSDRSAMKEIATNAALKVDPESVEAIREAMYSILHDATLRTDLINNARMRRNHFSWDRSAKIIFNKIIETARL